MKPSDLADHSIIVEGDTWGEQEQHVYKAVAEAVQADTLDAIVCMAGGWAGGSPASKDFVKNADAMWRQSVWPAAISAGLATKHLREGGICVLPGAAAAVGGTPGMAGYGMAKVSQDFTSFLLSINHLFRLQFTNLPKALPVTDLACPKIASPLPFCLSPLTLP